MDRPGIYLCEIQQELKTQIDLDVSLSAICKFLHKCGQRLCTYALQRDETRRAQFATVVSLYRPEMLLFLGEIPFERRAIV